MTKEEARNILNEYIKSKYFLELPIEDERIIRSKRIGKFSTSNYISEYTFKGLIKIAYDL